MPLAWGVNIAVGCMNVSGEEVVVRDGAAGAGVECHGVGRLLMDTFDDVDFATVEHQRAS